MLNNEKEVQTILKNMVQHAYEQIKEDEILLCMECCDVDLFVAKDSHPELEEAIKKNFELDEYGDIVDQQSYTELMRKLDDLYVDLHIESGNFDYFPAGIYQVNGQDKESETDILAPKGVFYAPFEEAVKKENGK
ncbi:hypothetical protein [Niallia sp. 01092]|uniref:hypothetical protein n=1 Tax=unclassified Niallia TaxID=2837522 RepID=UPI003FD56DB9